MIYSTLLMCRSGFTEVISPQQSKTARLRTAKGLRHLWQGPALPSFGRRTSWAVYTCLVWQALAAHQHLLQHLLWQLLSVSSKQQVM